MKELYNRWSTSFQNRGTARAGRDQSNPSAENEAGDTETSPERQRHIQEEIGHRIPQSSASIRSPRRCPPAPPLHPPAPLPRPSAEKRRGNAPPASQAARSPCPRRLTRSSSMSAGQCGRAGRRRGAGMLSWYRRSRGISPAPPRPARTGPARACAPATAQGHGFESRPGRCGAGRELRCSVRPETASHQSL